MNEYNAKPLDLLSISEGARRAGIASQRFRRAIKILKIPVYRSGWGVMIENKSIATVKKALREGGVIRRGRPKKKA